ncbi:MAG TPA: hypothetical protein VKI19_06455, partial [Acidimicrobiales bacterium]|nr:hypothetical protein [Acidimicrobiales bacterium]
MFHRKAVDRALALVGSLFATTGLVATSVVIGGVVAPEPASASTPPPGQAGSLDASWGSGGVATLTVSGFTNLTPSNRVVTLANGDVVFAGVQRGLAGSAVVVALTPAGALDSAFGTGGVVRTGLGSGAANDSISIALQSTTGDILVGTSETSGSASLGVVERLTPAGALDATFGTAGRTALANGYTGVTSLISNAAGVIDLASRQANNGDDPPVIQLKASGLLDTSFGASGYGAVDTEFPPAVIADLAFGTGGQIVATGTAVVAGVTHTFVGRLTSAGQPDNTFGSSSIAMFNISGASIADAPAAVAVDGSNRILVTGTTTTSPTSVFALRTTSAGAPDGSFGTSGVSFSTYDGVLGSGGAVTVDPAGRYLVAGGTAASGSGANALGLERLTSGSSPFDSSFGTTAHPGRESIACPSGAGAASALSPGGGLHPIVAGSCNGSLVIALLNSGTISNLTMTALTPQAPAGHGTVPLSSIPNTAITGTDPNVTGAPGFGLPGFGLPGFGLPGYYDPLTSSPLIDPAVDQVPLTSIPLSPPASGTGPTSWEAALAGTPLDGIPTQSITLAQVLALNPRPASLSGITLADIALSGSTLMKVSLGAFLLGTTPVSSLPTPAGSSSWCAFLAGQPDNCTTNSAGTAQSLIDLELGGDSLQSYYSGTPVNLVGLAVQNSPLTYLPIQNIDMSLTSLGQVATTALKTPATFLNCTPSSTSSSCDTLFDAQKQSNLAVTA